MKASAMWSAKRTEQKTLPDSDFDCVLHSHFGPRCEQWCQYCHFHDTLTCNTETQNVISCGFLSVDALMYR